MRARVEHHAALRGIGGLHVHRRTRHEDGLAHPQRGIVGRQAAALQLADVLRRNDAAYEELGLTGKESRAVLLRHMAEHPTLLQRPIAIVGRKAVVGRPPERILALVT